jgi:cell wall-associated NlpC family hydrolase
MMAANGAALVGAAMRYGHYRYKLGAKGAGGALDCSGMTWIAARDVGIATPHGTVNQFPWCERARLLISVDHAIATPGAWLFVWRGPGGGGGAGNHVAISRGDGTTIEARSTRLGCGIFTARNRGFTHGALVPGVNYAPPAPPPAPGPAPGVLTPGTVLGPDQSVTSPSGSHVLVYQRDGNLVLYRVNPWRALWSSGTPFGLPGFAAMQPDGNFVIYGCLGAAAWSTKTQGRPNAWAAVQDDGNFVIYHGLTPIWASGTDGQ